MLEVTCRLFPLGVLFVSVHSFTSFFFIPYNYPHPHPHYREKRQRNYRDNRPFQNQTDLTLQPSPCPAPQWISRRFVRLSFFPGNNNSRLHLLPLRLLPPLHPPLLLRHHRHHRRLRPLRRLLLLLCQLWVSPHQCRYRVRVCLQQLYSRPVES